MSVIIVSLLESERLDLTLALSGDMTGSVETTFVSAPIDLNLGLSGAFGGLAQTETSLNGRLSPKGDLAGTVRLQLAEPAPVLNDLTAFLKSCLPRLLVNGVERGIYGFTLDAPRNEIGKRLSVQVTNQSLTDLTPAAKFSFQMNARNLPFAADDWRTLIQSADLDSRQVGVRFRGDNLSISVVSPAEDALRRFPTASKTIYNPDKTDFDVKQIEKMRTESGAIIPYTADKKRNLNLYWLLFHVAKETGVSLIETNIPNFEIARADFSIMQSWRDSIAPYFGAYDTLWLADGDSIQIIDKSQIVPDEHEFFEVTVDKFLSWQMEMPERARRDGFEIVFNGSDLEADYYIDEVITLPAQPSGTFGSANYQRIETVQTFRKWFNSEFPDIELRKELIREVRTTKAPLPPYTVTLSTIAVFTVEHFYDRTGKRISSKTTHETRMPDVDDPGTIILTKTAETRQTVSYTADPKNSRRFLPQTIITYREGLIVEDEENPYINPQTGEEAPFRQEYALHHRAGNLTFEGGQTKEYGPISQTTEQLVWTGGDTFQSTVSTIYYTSGNQSEPVSEPRAGDASVSGTSAATRKVYVYRDGYSASVAGYGFESFAVGELPLRFAIPLAKRKLAQRETRKQSGVLEIGGYSPDLKRGALLKVKDRAGNSYGKFIVEGFQVSGERNEKGWLITSRLSVAEI